MLVVVVHKVHEIKVSNFSIKWCKWSYMRYLGFVRTFSHWLIWGF